jgi:outer membrane protein assembly factor BamB
MGAAGDLLVLDAGSAIRVQGASTGRVTLDAPGAVATWDGSEVVAASPDGERTVVHAMDPTTGRITSSIDVPGDLAIRVVSGDGTRAALMAPLPEGSDPWTPVPRATTRIDVVDPSGGGRVRRFVLNGDFEPEAFSTDDATLFLISYLPPTNPSAYKVARLDLDTGKMHDVYGRYKTPPETMTGTRLTQVAAPDGEQLYTLYSNQPAAYAKGYEAPMPGEDEVAFIHTLSLKDGWAYCAGLPKGFGTGSQDAKSIAVSPDGSTVYAVDAQHDVVTTMNPDNLNVAPARHVDLGLPESGVTSARVAADGTLFVGRGSTVVALDAARLQVLDRWRVAGVLNGLALGSDGTLYAATGDGVLRLNSTTGVELGVTPAPGVRGILYAGNLGGPAT